MLVLKRKEGEWVDVKHKSGDLVRVRVCHIRPGLVDLVFDDSPRNFDIQRPERAHAPAAGTGTDTAKAE